MKKYILLVLVSLFSTAGYSAIEIADITSRARLIDAIYRETRSVDAYVWAPSAFESEYVYSSWTTQYSESKILAELGKLNPKIKLADITDTISFQYSVEVDGETALYASNSGKALQVGTAWTLPESLTTIKLQLSYLIKVKFDKQVSYAYAAAKDNYGNMIFSSDFYTYGNYVYFPTQYVGNPTAYLVVNYTDGTNSIISIAQGKAVVQTEVGLQVKASTEGVSSYKDESTVTLSVKSTYGVGTSPLIVLDRTVAGNVTVNVSSTEGRTPTGYWVKTATTAAKVITATAGSAVIPAAVGATHVIPIWKDTDFREEAAVVTYDGNGKG